MDDPLDHRSNAFVQARRRLARLFGSAKVVNIADDAFIVDVAYKSTAMDALERSIRWGRSRGLLHEHKAAVYSGPPGDPVPCINIVARIAGDDKPSVTVENPVVHPAHFVACHPSAVSLVASVENAPAVIRPDITAPDSARVAGLVISPPRKPKMKILPIPDLKARGKISKQIHVEMTPARLLPVTPDICEQIFMERRRLPMPPRGAMAEDTVYPEQRAALAASAGLPQSDIKLVGVYCDVPLGAASQMEYDEITGSLHLTLRENAATTVLRLQRPVVTLVLGKVKATGKVVRAFL